MRKSTGTWGGVRPECQLRLRPACLGFRKPQSCPSSPQSEERARPCADDPAVSPDPSSCLPSALCLEGLLTVKLEKRPQCPAPAFLKSEGGIHEVELHLQPAPAAPFLFRSLPQGGESAQERAWPDPFAGTVLLTQLFPVSPGFSVSRRGLQAGFHACSTGGPRGPDSRPASPLC